LFQFTGCSKGIKDAPTVRWNDTNYTIMPNIVVAKEDIGEQINTIKKIVKPTVT